MPLIIPARTLADSSYEIEKSLQFNGANQYLSRTPSSASNRKTWTYSIWVKRGKLGSQQAFLGADSGGNTNTHIRFRADDAITWFHQISGSDTYFLNTTAKFLDPFAWLHIVITLDTTQGTSTNRLKMYVNGSQITSFTSTLYPSQNLDDSINSNVAHDIGQRSGMYFGGYMSEIHFVDGTALTPTSFGEYNDNGVWIPKDCKDNLTYGTNGYYLEFKQSGTSANTSGIGADTSGETNHWSVSALGANSPALDTPTNNYSVLNNRDPRQGATFTANNIGVTTNSSNRNYVISSIGVKSGKWYCEARVTSTSNQAWIGVADFDDLLVSSSSTLGDNSNEIGLNFEGTYQKNNSNNASWAGSWSDNDIIGILLDMDNNRVTYHKNGSYADGSGNYDESSPTAYISFTNSTMGFAFGDGGGSASSEIDTNFGGAISFNISSSNTDANGYGNFEYAVPSGYYALNTKNLAEYG